MTQSVQLKKDDQTVVLYYPDVLLQEQRMNPNLLKPTGYVMHKQAEHFNIVRSAHTAFMSFAFVREKTATCSIYIKN
jgi:hypothetical protein